MYKIADTISKAMRMRNVRDREEEVKEMLLPLQEGEVHDDIFKNH